MGETLNSHPLRAQLFGKMMTGDGALGGVRFLKKGQTMDGEKASATGTFVNGDGVPILVNKGDVIPSGFKARAEASATPPPPPPDPPEHPKWYLEKVAAAEAANTPIPEREPDETKAAYEERVAGLAQTQTGPDENQQGAGPSETS